VHELAIAQSMVEISRRHARGRRVTRLEVRVGHLRQVVPESLTFALELVAQGTELEGAELHIEHVPAAGTCRDCGSTVPLPDFPLMCSACGGLDLDADDAAAPIFEHEVDLLPGVGPVVVQRRAGARPAELLGQLHRDEVLEQPADEHVVAGQAILIDPRQVGGQSGVGDRDLGRLDQTLAPGGHRDDAGQPGRGRA